MLRTGQQYLHALHESRIMWVGNPLITPAIFGNSLWNVVASTNATIARPASHAPLGLLTHLEPHQPGTLARSIFIAWKSEFLRLLNKDLKGGRALPSRQRPCRCAGILSIRRPVAPIPMRTLFHRAHCAKKYAAAYAADIARMKRVRGDAPVKKAL
jgi:hypothetical protein